MSERARFTLGLVLACAAVLAVRLVSTQPTFLHANFHAGSLVESILEYPARAGDRAGTYGGFGFFLLGMVARLFGRRFEVVSAANQVCAAATLFLMAWLAFRWTRERWSAWFVVAAGALHVATARVAASEDAHNLAVLLGGIALLGFDVYGERGSRRALAVGTAALAAMVHTRQTLYPLVLCAYGLALARGGPSLLRRAPFLLSALVTTAVLAQRVVTTLGSPSERTSFIVIGLIFATPKLLAEIVRCHPLLDVARFGPFPTLLLVAGCVAGWRARGAPRAAVLSFALLFLVSLPTAFRTPGVELAFRLPAVTLGLALCGLGGAWLARGLRGRTPLLVAACLLVAAAPPAFSAFAMLRQQSADFLEYRFLRDHAAELPHRFVLERIETTPAMPSYAPPLALLRRAGLELVPADRPPPPDGDAPPRLVFAGVQCWGWSMGELLGLGDDPRKVTREQLATWGRAVVRGELGALPVPATLRPECAALLDGAVPVGPAGEIAAPLSDPPFVLYGVPSIPLRFHRLPPR